MDNESANLDIGKEINNIAGKIHKLINGDKENFPRLELEIDMQCMKLQALAEKLGVFYID